MSRQEVKTTHQEDPQVTLDRLAAQYLEGKLELQDYIERDNKVAPTLPARELSGAACLEP